MHERQLNSLVCDSHALSTPVKNASVACGALHLSLVKMFLTAVSAFVTHGL